MSRKAKYLIGLCGLLLACGATLAKSGRFILWGAGNDSCATFVQERARASVHFQIEISWIAGFVSAGNGEWAAKTAGKGIESDFLEDADHVGLEAWLVKFCNTHPLDNLSTAAFELEKVLLDRAATR